MSERVADVRVETLQAAGVKNCWRSGSTCLRRCGPRHRSQRERLGPYAAREAGAFAAGTEALLTGPLHLRDFANHLRLHSKGKKAVLDAIELDVARGGVRSRCFP